MQRHNAMATARSVTATVTTAFIALGGNFDIFGLTDENSNVDKFPAVERNAHAVMSPLGGRASRQEDMQIA